MRFFLLFSFVFLFSHSAYSEIHFSVDDLRGWYEQMEDADSALSGSEKAAARGFRYVLVKGFLNEAIPGYLHDTRDFLLETGVPDSQIHFISPQSLHSIEEDGSQLEEELQAIASQGDEPLILIGHSKGASGLVAFGLLHSDFLKKHVKAIVSIQGVFSGSGIADAIYFWSTKHRRALQWTGYADIPAALFSIAATAVRPLVSVGALFGSLQGVRSLTHRYNGEFWEKIRGRSGEPEIQAVAERTLFLRTWQPLENQKWYLRPLGGFLHHAYGNSDTLLHVEEQLLNWVKPASECAVFLANADHQSLAHNGFFGSGVSEVRRKMTASLLKGLAR